MTSEKQVQANRRNALMSTGPTSQKGKQRSSQNAVKHAILSEAVIVHGEQATDFDEFRSNMFEDLKPVGTLEVLLLEKAVYYAWRLRRVLRAEAQMFHEELSSQYSGKKLHDFFSGYLGKRMANLSRYEMMLSKLFYKALTELSDIQTSRPSSQTVENSPINGFVSNCS